MQQLGSLCFLDYILLPDQRIPIITSISHFSTFILDLPFPLAFILFFYIVRSSHAFISSSQVNVNVNAFNIYVKKIEVSQNQGFVASTPNASKCKVFMTNLPPLSDGFQVVISTSC